MNTNTKTHDAGCIAHARKCAWENLRDDGQPITASPELLTDDALAWEIPVGQLLAEWLADGSVSCRCVRRSVLAEVDAVDFAYAVCREFVTQNLIDGEPVPVAADVAAGYIDAHYPRRAERDVFRMLLTLRLTYFVDGLKAAAEVAEDVDSETGKA